MNSYLLLIDTGVSFDTLRRLQGKFELMLLDARAIRAQGETMRELVASTEVVHMLEEAVARCREVACKKKRYLGWNKANADRGRRGNAAGARPPARRAARGSRAARRDGPWMARSSCAGSAAGVAMRSGNALPSPSDAEGNP